MVFGSHANTRAIYSTPPCPSLAASTAAYRRRSFSDSHPKKRCIFPSISAEYPSTSYSLLRDLLRRQDTTAQAIREVILNHILKTLLAPFGITKFYTDGWGAYERHLDTETHHVGKENTQKIESKHINLRTRIKRLVR